MGLHFINRNRSAAFLKKVPTTRLNVNNTFSQHSQYFVFSSLSFLGISDKTNDIYMLYIHIQLLVPQRNISFKNFPWIRIKAQYFPHFMIVWLSHYMIVWLSDYMIVWLPHYMIVWLVISDYVIIWLSDYHIIWLSDYMIVRITDRNRSQWATMPFSSSQLPTLSSLQVPQSDSHRI